MTHRAPSFWHAFAVLPLLLLLFLTVPYIYILYYFVYILYMLHITSICGVELDFYTFSVLLCSCVYFVYLSVYIFSIIYVQSLSLHLNNLLLNRTELLNWFSMFKKDLFYSSMSLSIWTTVDIMWWWLPVPTQSDSICIYFHILGMQL